MEELESKSMWKISLVGTQSIDLQAEWEQGEIQEGWVSMTHEVGVGKIEFLWVKK